VWVLSGLIKIEKLAAIMHLHHYSISTVWTGNTGRGTASYSAYERSHTVHAEGKPILLGSSDPAFRGDQTRYNPEELLLSALSTCHMLSYLHVCTVAGVVVTAYEDKAAGTMEQTPDGGGHFTEVTLQPIVTVKEASMMEKAIDAHHKANKLCFVANSVNFPVHHKPECRCEETNHRAEM
jgi:organic hydroperoxide reductase OsmC/OhrA